MKGIEVCSNEGLGPLQRGDNKQNVKMGLDHLKIFFQRTNWPGMLKFTWKHSDIVKNQVCYNQCPSGQTGATIREIVFTYMCV